LVWFGLSIGSENWNREPNQTTSVFYWFDSVFDPNHKIRFFFGLNWFGSSIPLNFSDPLTPLHRHTYLLLSWCVWEGGRGGTQFSSNTAFISSSIHRSSAVLTSNLFLIPPFFKILFSSFYIIIYDKKNTVFKPDTEFKK
jgi:hypothetical protein